MDTSAERTFDLAEVPPLRRTQLLVEELDRLSPGEAIRLHSDEYPLPLLDRLADERFGEFTSSFSVAAGGGWTIVIRKR